MQRRQLKNILMTLAIGVWLLWLASAAFQFQFSAKRVTQVRLRTTPETVKIELNGQEILGKGYIKTPVNLQIPPGEHTLRLTRDGYVPLKINIDATMGSSFEIDPTFDRKEGAEFGRLAIETNLDEPLRASIDGGLADGRIPMTVEDLLLDKPHLITIYQDDPEHPLARCRMKFNDGTDFEEVTVLRQRGGQLKLTGCKRTKSKND